jgi:type IV pilus assembly protein PilM
LQGLFKNHLVGDITTNRVAMSLPIAHAFTRSIEVPELTDKELLEAVHTEAEQYVQGAIDDMYIDYTRNGQSGEKSTVFIVAMPKKIVNSYLMVSRLLGLEAVLLQTSSGAGATLFARDKRSDTPTVLVDLGSESADITVYDKGPVLSGTTASGGEQLTQLIVEALGVTDKEATLIKTKYGLGYSKKQAQIRAALQPPLSSLIKEIRRTIRYYEEHSESKRTISQVLIMGGGANMPGLPEYFTDQLRLPVRPFDPTVYIDFGHLRPISTTDRMSYVTATGVGITDPTEVFA